jgi:hypothetical protein
MAGKTMFSFRAGSSAQNRRRRQISAILGGLLLAAFGIISAAAVTAQAAVIAPAHQVTEMGVTSSGQIFNLEKPPSWLKPNTLVRPLNYVSPDELYYGGYYACFSAISCLNNWNGGGLGNLIRWFHYGTTLNPARWILCRRQVRLSRKQHILQQARF